MSIVYPIIPGSGSAPPVFSTSTNGLVPAPGAGLPTRVLTPAGTWAVPSATTIVLNPSATTGILGGVSWSSVWADPITLSTSVLMTVFRMNSNIYNVSLGSGSIDVTISSSSAQMITRNRWGAGLNSVNFGLYSAGWNCDFYGNIFVGGFWYLVTGGASLNAGVSDLLITKLT